jgi:hypothetical protein
MHTTHRIALLLSGYLIVTGLGFLLSADYYAAMIAHTGTDPVLINLSGMVHFFIGMGILVHHFVWKSALQIMVTILGLMFLLKGLFLIALPELTLQAGNNPAQVPWAMAIGFVGAGLVLGYMALFGKRYR